MKNLLLFILASALSLLGCTPPDAATPSTIAITKPTLAEQLHAIRAGTTDILHIEEAPWQDDDLDQLTDVAGLRILQLDDLNNRLTDAGMAKIAKLDGLEHLRIRGGAIGDEGLKSLSTMPNLRGFNLPQGRFTNAGIAQLKSLPKLQMLRIGSPHVTDEGIAHFKNFPSLARVHLIDIPITDRGLADLQSLPKLESLYLDGANISDAAVDRLFEKRPDLHVHFNQAHHDRDPHKHEHAKE